MNQKVTLIGNLTKDTKNNEIIDADNYHELYIYLLNNGYTINSDLTNMINKSTFKSSKNLLCFISYKID